MRHYATCVGKALQRIVGPEGEGGRDAAARSAHLEEKAWRGRRRGRRAPSEPLVACTICRPLVV